MNANGVLASMNFPTMAGFNARTFTESADKEAALVSLQAYNDWAIDEWCGAYPGRFIPLGIVPMWDVELAAAEAKRVAKKGCRSISFLETPHVQGFPSFLSGYWDPMLKAISDENMVLSLHIGAGFGVIQKPIEAPVDHLIVLACQISAITAQDLLFGPTLRAFPDLQVALSEGGIGWIPFYFDRIDRHCQQPDVAERGGGLRRQEAFGRVPRAHPRLLHHRPVRTAAAGPDRDRHHRLGVRLPPHGHDVAHVARVCLGRVARGRVQRRRDPQDHLAELVPVLRLGPVQAHAKDQATVGALRALAKDVDVTRMPRARVAQAQRGRRHRRLLTSTAAGRVGRSAIVTVALA